MVNSDLDRNGLLDRALKIAALVVFFEAVGIAYYISLFGWFGLNYTDYADLNDILLGSIKEPIVFAVAFAAVMVLTFRERVSDNRIAESIIIASPFLVAFLMATIAHSFAVNFERHVPFSNTGQQLEIWLSDEFEAEGLELDRKIKSARLIGNVGGNYFLFDRLKSERVDHTIIIPEEHVIRVLLRQSY